MSDNNLVDISYCGDDQCLLEQTCVLGMCLPIDPEPVPISASAGPVLPLPHQTRALALSLDVKRAEQDLRKLEGIFRFAITTLVVVIDWLVLLAISFCLCSMTMRLGMKTIQMVEEQRLYIPYDIHRGKDADRL